MKITILVDDLKDAKRVLRAIEQAAKSLAEKPMPRRRDGILYVGGDLPGEMWKAMVWGTPDHVRGDCRACPYPDEETPE